LAIATLGLGIRIHSPPFEAKPVGQLPCPDQRIVIRGAGIVIKGIVRVSYAGEPQLGKVTVLTLGNVVVSQVVIDG